MERARKPAYGIRVYLFPRNLIFNQVYCESHQEPELEEELLELHHPELEDELDELEDELDDEDEDGGILAFCAFALEILASACTRKPAETSDALTLATLET